MYGTVFGGGDAGEGAVFELPQGSGTIISLGAFRTSNGANPKTGAMMDSSGNLYGTTPDEVNGSGLVSATVFELTQQLLPQYP